jgi:choline dehydrogenase-like flavoprotein
VGATGLGRVRLLLPEQGIAPLDLTGSHHHMGTTRMHRDPKQGVVDANSKLHGIANLSVAGSSVFPTYGAVNPTLTIIALALRLADHLRSRL